MPQDFWWPDDVTQNASRGSVTEQAERNVASFQPEVGPPSERRRSSVPIEQLSYTTIMSRKARESLKAFYRTTLADGVYDFRRKHPVGGGVIRCKFTAPPKFQQLAGDAWRVTIALRILPP